MRKSFHLDKSLSERHPGWRVPWWRVWLSVVAILLLVAFGSLLRRGLESPVTWLARPLLYANYQLTNGSATFWDYLSKQETLVAENRLFREETVSLKAKLLAAEQVIAEYRDLRETLGRTTNQSAGVVAKVIASPSQSPYDVIILDLGQADAAGQLVSGQLISLDDILLGTVATVFPNLTKGELFSSPRRELAVTLGPEAIPATITGAGGGNFRASLPRTVTITAGDLAVVPALGGRVVAQVGAVDNNPEEPFQTIYLKVPVNIYTLDWVRIHDF